MPEVDLLPKAIFDCIVGTQLLRVTVVYKLELATVCRGQDVEENVPRDGDEKETALILCAVQVNQRALSSINVVQASPNFLQSNE